jgi:Fe/S biogenesis protein NfuA
MLTFTETAKSKVSEILAQKGQGGFAVRLAIRGRTADSFLYDFRSVEETAGLPDDTVLDMGAFKVLVDPISATFLQGAVVDFSATDGGGFKIDNPNPVWTDPIAQAVARVITDRINPGIALHGGYIMLVDVQDGVAYVLMSGGCQGCGMARMTLQEGVSRIIREAVPEIKEVVDLTEHAAGANPYYPRGQQE